MRRIASLLACLLWAPSAWAITPAQQLILSGCRGVPPNSASLQQPPVVSAWLAASGASLTPNTVLSPSCFNNGGTVKEDTSANAHAISNAAPGTVTSGQYTTSVYVHSVSGSRGAGLTVWSSGFGSEAYVAYMPGTCANTIAATTTTNFSAGSATCTLTMIKGVSWAKITLTFTTSASDTGFQNVFYNSSAASFSYTGDGSSALAWWRPCIAAGSTC
jgi:hypothetical protein